MTTDPSPSPDERERLGRIAYQAFGGEVVPWADYARIVPEAREDWADVAEAVATAVRANVADRLAAADALVELGREVRERGVSLVEMLLRFDAALDAYDAAS